VTKRATFGHIKLSRKLFDVEHGDPFWTERREFSYFEAWVDLLQLACFKPYRYPTHYGIVELERGELVASQRFLADRWGWGHWQVRTFLSKCLKLTRLSTQRETQAGTVYLIVNYDTYQSVNRADGTANHTANHTEATQRPHKREAVKAVKAVTTTTTPSDSRPTTPVDEPSASPSAEHLDLDEPPKRRSSAKAPEPPGVEQVLEHYRAAYPSRRPDASARRAIVRALERGYSTADLCAAIDGNALDPWHRTNHKHEIEYVLREDKLDDFAEQGRAAPLEHPAVVDGWMNPELERLTRPERMSR
jgi:hypothetical protein